MLLQFNARITAHIRMRYKFCRLHFNQDVSVGQK